jgi:hypothetical protein
MAVREQELQAQKAEAERLEKLAEENARAYQLANEQTYAEDWSASLQESRRELDARRLREKATTYGDDGFGM